MTIDENFVVLEATRLFKEILKEHSQIIICMPDLEKIVIRNCYTGKNKRTSFFLEIKENEK